MTTKISVDESCDRLDEAWRPRVIATLNGQEVKLVRVKGVFPWHRHDDADEFFLVWKGQFSVEFHDLRIDMKVGECVLVPRGVEHRTSATVQGSDPRACNACSIDPVRFKCGLVNMSEPICTDQIEKSAHDADCTA